MRTISERRHNDFCAVQRQLKIAVVHGQDAVNSQAARQPHRLHKSSAISALEGGHISANPRRWAASAKDKMTPAELGNQQRYAYIEVPDLNAHEADRGGFMSNSESAQEIPSSARLLLG